jgi:hypothetical protein
MRSCSSPVLLEESTEHSRRHGASVILAQVSRPAGRVWWLQPERPVGTMGVVMLDVDAEDLLEVAAADDQQPVKALGTDGARRVQKLVHAARRWYS